MDLNSGEVCAGVDRYKWRNALWSASHICFIVVIGVIILTRAQSSLLEMRNALFPQVFHNNEEAASGSVVQNDAQMAERDYNADQIRNSCMAYQEDFPEEVGLIRFDLHKSVNREVGVPAGLPGYFTWYYGGQAYHCGFRFNKNGEGTESRTFGTAWVWAPYSIIHYDAAGGEIVTSPEEPEHAAHSTAMIGNVRLCASRGDGSLLDNPGDAGQAGNRFATDYTVYGNSLCLSEGILPTAVRTGYVFLGWYVVEQNGKMMDSEAQDLAENEEYEKLSELLNLPFTERTKVLREAQDDKTSLAEITVYAKWKKEE